jgi:hypothetical protein
MISKAMAGFALAIAFAATPTIVRAAGFGGGSAGAGMGSMSPPSFSVPVISMSSLPRIGHSGMAVGTGLRASLQPFPFPTNDPNHYHEIKLVGRFSQDESGLTIDRQIVRMRVDGRTIPMSIDGDAMSNSLQLDQGDELGQNLYRLILSRQLEVVGDQKLRAQIANAAAANPAASKPIEVDGFVYDRMTPYLVLVSVGDAR